MTVFASLSVYDLVNKISLKTLKLFSRPWFAPSGRCVPSLGCRFDYVWHTEPYDFGSSMVEPDATRQAAVILRWRGWSEKARIFKYSSDKLQVTISYKGTSSPCEIFFSNRNWDDWLFDLQHRSDDKWQDLEATSISDRWRGFRWLTHPRKCESSKEIECYISDCRSFMFIAGIPPLYFLTSWDG